MLRDQKETLDIHLVKLLRSATTQSSVLAYVNSLIHRGNEKDAVLRMGKMKIPG